MANVGLTQITTPEKIEYSGDLDIVVAEGQTFKIEDTPDGSEHIVGTVPAGKQWRITGPLHILETDAP